MNRLSLLLTAPIVFISSACLQDFDQFRGEGGGSTTTTTSTSTGMGGEGGAGCVDPALCPPTGNECVANVCTAGQCAVANEPQGTACTDGAVGAKVCTGTGSCVECNGNPDCTDVLAPICAGGFCVAEHCLNGVPDPAQGETGLDCGGTDCPPCGNGQGCAIRTDCESGFCNNLLCEACSVDGNCDTATEWCDSSANGGSCVPKNPNGTTCGDDSECTTDNCVDGVCCGSASCPSCQSCDIAGSLGTCANDASGTSCNDGQFCTQTDTCNGSGTCVGAGNPCPGPDGDGDCSETCREAQDDCNGNDTNGSACNDGQFCTMTDACNNSGTCVGTGNPCPGPDGDGDCSETCREAQDDCNGNDTNGSACNDGLFCTTTDACNNSGTCIGTGNPCPGHNTGPNCNDSCDDVANNCNGNDAAATSCNDGLFCTVTDACNAGGSCVGTGNPCPGHNTGNSTATSCEDSCNDTADNCTALDLAGTACDEDNDMTNGTCTGMAGEPNCSGD